MFSPHTMGLSHYSPPLPCQRRQPASPTRDSITPRPTEPPSPVSTAAMAGRSLFRPIPAWPCNRASLSAVSLLSARRCAGTRTPALDRDATGGALNPATPPADGTYWFSVVVNAGGIAQGNFNWMYTTKSTNGQNGVGFRTSNSGGALNFKPVNPNTDGNAELQAGTGTVGTPSLIVGRLVLTGGSDSTFRIWVNPATDPNTVPGDGDSNSAQTIVSAADTATIRASISGRAFGTGGGGSGELHGV